MEDDDRPQNAVELLTPPEWRELNIFGRAFYLVGMAAVFGGLYWFSGWFYALLTAWWG